MLLTNRKGEIPMITFEGIFVGVLGTLVFLGILWLGRWLRKRKQKKGKVKTLKAKANSLGTNQFWTRYDEGYRYFVIASQHGKVRALFVGSSVLLVLPQIKGGYMTIRIKFGHFQNIFNRRSQSQGARAGSLIFYAGEDFAKKGETLGSELTENEALEWIAHYL